jgi:hypothetical protein
MAEIGTWKWIVSFWISCAFAAACYSFVVWFGLWLHPDREWFRLVLKAMWRVSLAFGLLMFSALVVTSIRKLTRH